jgi:cephalosporin hydroxylase
MWERLVQAWYPGDVWQSEPHMRDYYLGKFAVVQEIQPTTICEIGVRAGYSAFAFLCAAPNARYVGIDNNTEFVSGTDSPATRWASWAASILMPWNVTLINTDSQQLTELPGVFDFVHVDGDHSYDSCLHDLELCFACTFSFSQGVPGRRYVLVDDYDNDVKRACDLVRARPGIHSRYIESHCLFHLGEMLLWTE